MLEALILSIGQLALAVVFSACVLGVVLLVRDLLVFLRDTRDDV